MLLAGAALFAGLLQRAWRSEGYYWADDYTHLEISRAARTNFDALLNVWGRPLMTLAYVPAAVQGDGAVRATSLGLFLLTAVACAAIADRRKTVLPAAAAVLLFGQPLAATLAYCALPQTAFSLVLAVALWLRATGRQAGAALVASLLPMARLEGVLVLAIWGVVLFRERRPRTCALLAFGLATWAVASALHTSDPLSLWHGNPYGFLGSRYPRAGWTYLFHAFPVATGPLAGGLALAALAFPRMPDPLVGALALGLSLFYPVVWGLPAFQSFGDPVYLVSVSVPYALCAHHALAALRSGADRSAAGGVSAVAAATLCAVRGPHALGLGLLAVVALALAAARIPEPRPAVGSAALAGLLMVAVVVTGLGLTHRIRLEPGAFLARQLIEDLGPRIERVVLWSHPAFGWYAGRLPTMTWEQVGLAPPGSLVLWDVMFGGRENGISEDMLRVAGFEPVWQGRRLWARAVLWEKRP